MKSRDAAAAAPVYVVTGSSRGIGRETARVLLARGYSVVINGRNETALHRTGEALTGYSVPSPASAGPPLLAVAADVSTEAGAAHLVSRTLETYGRIDGLVNNAGISMRGRIQDLRCDTIDKLYRGNILSAVLPTVAALPELEKTRGHVVFVSTVAALWGFPGVSMYSATKAAVETFARAVDAEARRSGVRTTTVYLGFVENDPDKETLAADGTMFRHTRKAQQTQLKAATAIAEALQGRRRRVITIPSGVVLDRVARFLPGVVALFLARSGGRIHRT